MPIASWMLPVLWREHDWCAALERLAGEVRAGTRTPMPPAALALGAAYEYIEPDRRRALASYALAGRDGAARARDLAVELGWWGAVARLGALAGGSPLDEAEAWWDAGQPELAALVLAGIRAADRGARGGDLEALLDHRDRARDAASRGKAEHGPSAASAFVMAARFARAGGRVAEERDHLEAALAACPDHAIAARQLLALAVTDRDASHVQRFLQLRLEGQGPGAWIDAMRACAIELVATDHHRGFGLRLLRYTLERAYQLAHDVIPGHLAMWNVLAARAKSAGTRRELLPLVLAGLDATTRAFDRVWLGALATEISLQDANHPVVAGGYAEIVAEHAPEHPVIKALVTNVAASGARPAVPAEAVTAAARVQQDESFDIEVDLGGVYAEAAEQALNIEIAPPSAVRSVASKSRLATAGDEAAELGIADIVSQANLQADAAPPARLASSSQPAARSEPAPELPKRDVPPPPIPAPKPAPEALLAAEPTAAPAPLPAAATPKVITIPKLEKTAPLARITPVARPASQVKDGGMPRLAPPPVAIKSQPVLAALRIPNRPSVPPKPADPPDAKARARRIAISIDVRLFPPSGAPVDGHSRDVSETGLFVLTTGKLAVGTTLPIELLLPGDEAFTETEYRARARVVRQGHGGYGIELVDPEPALVQALARL
jgi:hypothetical protein